LVKKRKSKLDKSFSTVNQNKVQEHIQNQINNTSQTPIKLPLVPPTGRKVQSPVPFNRAQDPNNLIIQDPNKLPNARNCSIQSASTPITQEEVTPMVPMKFQPQSQEPKKKSDSNPVKEDISTK
jgi:hypothetical protein